MVGETIINTKVTDIVFDAIKYNMADVGEHTYTVEEVAPEGGLKDGVTYDTAVYTVVVEVKDSGDGQLILTVKSDGKDITQSTEDVIKFVNNYSVKPGSIDISGTKELDGRELKADEFEFALYDQDGKQLQTVKNDADGSFKFGAIPVDKAGEYVYTVKELKGNEEGITYDDTVYTVTVTVEDGLKGLFNVVYAYEKGTARAEEN